jgi:hypothetical protein
MDYLQFIDWIVCNSGSFHMQSLHALNSSRFEAYLYETSGLYTCPLCWIARIATIKSQVRIIAFTDRDFLQFCCNLKSLNKTHLPEQVSDNSPTC